MMTFLLPVSQIHLNLHLFSRLIDNCKFWKFQSLFPNFATRFKPKITQIEKKNARTVKIQHSPVKLPKKNLFETDKKSPKNYPFSTGAQITSKGSSGRDFEKIFPDFEFRYSDMPVQNWEIQEFM